MDTYRVTIECQTGEDADFRRSVRTEETDSLNWSLLWALKDSDSFGVFSELMAWLLNRYEEGRDDHVPWPDPAVQAAEDAFMLAAADYEQAIVKFRQEREAKKGGV